ncbi:cold shock protein 2-like [Cryptomeria japonica]|uniref:cold shock protein 2-like n=1 Tax=Cryptomeria japonica TaxID=3369 RepID=UPI0027DAA32D|nr:cold shock protein 2-like [Cryptomeria japonica]
MLPAFDDEEDEQPERQGGVRQIDEEGEEVGQGGGDDGGGDGGGGGGGYGGDRGGLGRDRGQGGDGGRDRARDRGRGGDGERGGELVLGVGGVGRVGAMLAAVGGIEDDRRPAQRRRSNVLPPVTPQIGKSMGGTTTQVPIQIRVPTHR